MNRKPFIIVLILAVFDGLVTAFAGLYFSPLAAGLGIAFLVTLEGFYFARELVRNQRELEKYEKELERVREVTERADIWSSLQ